MAIAEIIIYCDFEARFYQNNTGMRTYVSKPTNNKNVFHLYRS